MVDVDHLKRHFADLNDEELLAASRSDLVPEARRVVQDELDARAGLARRAREAPAQPQARDASAGSGRAPTLPGLGVGVAWCRWAFWVTLLGGIAMLQAPGLMVVYALMLGALATAWRGLKRNYHEAVILLVVLTGVVCLATLGLFAMDPQASSGRQFVALAKAAVVLLLFSVWGVLASASAMLALRRGGLVSVFGPDAGQPRD